jgi:hypothetical protein
MPYIIALVFIGTFILYYLYIVSGVPCPRGGSFTLLILPAPVVLSIRPSPPPAVLPLPILYCNLCESFIPFLDLSFLFLMIRPRRRPFSMYSFFPERDDFISLLLLVLLMLMLLLPALSLFLLSSSRSVRLPCCFPCGINVSPHPVLLGSL